MLSHLLEFRRRLLIVFSLFLGLFILCYVQSSFLFSQVVSPLLRSMPAQNVMIATHILSPLITPIQLAANVALLCIAPVALYHLWRFISPGLYAREEYHFRWAMLMSLLLFGLGMLFCYFLVLPMMLKCLIQSLPNTVRFMPDMADAVSFITRMVLLFGVCFQVPLVCVMLVRLGVMTVASLKAFRPYAVVGAFILGMLLTPPDVLSQILLALPLCLLYELGIFLCGMRVWGVGSQVN